MKKNILWVSALLGLVACSNDDELQNSGAEQDSPVTVIATLPGNDTRVTLQDVTDGNGKNIIKVDWRESGECFTAMTTGAVGYENQERYRFHQTSGDEFQGVLPEKIDGQPYYAFYPVVNLRNSENDGYRYRDNEGNELSAFSATCVPFDFYDQNGTLDENNTLMVATSTDGGSFAFKHLTAIVKFTLSGLPTNVQEAYFQMSWDGGCPTNGCFDLTQADIASMYPESEDGFIQIATPITDKTATFYAYLPPVAKGKTLEIICGYNDEEYAHICSTSVELAEKGIDAGKFYRVARTMEVESQSRQMTAGSVEELQAWVDAFQKFGGGINLTLTGDIDLTEADLDGDSENESNWPWLDLYGGVTINGNGHTLKGVKRVVGDESASLFGSIDESSVVQHLHLTDVNFSSSEYYASGVVSDNFGRVVGCSVSGTIECGNTGYPCGGIVGYNNSSGRVIACYSTASVAGGYCCGSIAGSNYNVGEDVEQSGIKACYYTSGNYGIGYDELFEGACNNGAEKVDGNSITWASVIGIMNQLLTEYASDSYKYELNGDEATKEAMPLKLIEKPEYEW